MLPGDAERQALANLRHDSAAPRAACRRRLGCVSTQKWPREQGMLEVPAAVARDRGKLGNFPPSAKNASNNLVDAGRYAFRSWWGDFRRVPKGGRP